MVKGKSFSAPKRLKRRGRLTSTYFCRLYDAVTQGDTWVSTQCRTHKAAVEWVRSREMEQAIGPERAASQEHEDRGFLDAYHVWLAEKETKVSPKFHGCLKCQGERYWIPFFGKLRLREITTDHLREYARRRKAGTLSTPGEPKKPKTVAAATANGDLRALRNFFNFSLRNGWLTRSPMPGVDNFSGEMKRRVRSITAEEERRLLAACEDGAVIAISAHRNTGGTTGGSVTADKRAFRQTVPVPIYLRPLVETAIYCGFRRRTLLSLLWKHCDLASGRWHIPGELFKTREDYHAPIPRRVVKTLVAYRAKLATECERKRIPVGERLALTAAIFGLEPASSVKKSFHRAATRADLPELTLHDCRRIYLNKLREKGVPLETAMRLTGHKSIQTVLRYYRDTPDADLKAAVDALEGGALPGGPSAAGTSGLPAE